MHVRAKIWIESDGGKLLLGEGRMKIFDAIERTGSLSAAARDLKMSYRAVWGKVRATEERLGIKLVEGVSGGPNHGGAQLTVAGHRFSEHFSEFERRAHEAVEALAEDLLEKIRDDDGGDE